MKNPIFERLDIIGAILRLKEFPTLMEILGPQWLEMEYKKKESEYSLLMGWISLKEPTFIANLSSLEEVITNILPIVNQNVKQKIISKLSSYTDRANIKGTISEIALINYLIQNKISFGYEVSITNDNKNVDFQIDLGGDLPIYIELARVAEPDSHKRANLVASSSCAVIPLFTEKDWYHLFNKIYDKIPKLTKEHVTFIALDLTDIEYMGGPNLAPIRSLAREIFTGSHLEK